MKRTTALFLAAAAGLLAYSDADMDGVEDKLDRCPYTSFDELVDAGGCTIKKLKAPPEFDIIAGLNFYQADYATVKKSDTVSKSLQVDYYDGGLCIQAVTSHYDSDYGSGMDDSFIGAFYKYSLNRKLLLRVGAGLILPTYDSELGNNNTDYTASINASYLLDEINIFGGYGYTVVNDDDVAGVAYYQNSSSISVGAGFYPQKNLYISTSYTSSESIYKDVETIETLSVYGLYTVNANWFGTMSYAYGLSNSASDNSISLHLGYRF